VSKTVKILLEVQGKEILLWVDCELVKSWKTRNTIPSGKPLECGRLVESVLALVHVPCQMEFGDGFEFMNEE